MLFTTSIFAQSGGLYDLSWWTVTSGSTSNGDNYTLSSIIGQPEAGVTSEGGGYTLVAGFWSAIGQGRGNIYLPLIVKNYVFAPDLIVESITATSNAVAVTIKNIGDAPVTDAFWLDLYFAPNTVPGLNQRWQDIAGSGVVWGIQQGAADPLHLPIEPNETRILTLDKAYFGTLGSSPPPYPIGVTVYARVDSVDYSTTYGAVLEKDEGNNLFGPVTSTAGSGTNTELMNSSESVPGADLPSRE